MDNMCLEAAHGPILFWICRHLLQCRNVQRGEFVPGPHELAGLLRGIFGVVGRNDDHSPVSVPSDHRVASLHVALTLSTDTAAPCTLDASLPTRTLCEPESHENQR